MSSEESEEEKEDATNPSRDVKHESSIHNLINEEEDGLIPDDIVIRKPSFCDKLFPQKKGKSSVVQPEGDGDGDDD